jgi:hypothetical protein
LYKSELVSPDWAWQVREKMAVRVRVNFIWWLVAAEA